MRKLMGNRTWKQAAAVLMAVCMAITLAGCGSSDSKNGTSPATGQTEAKAPAESTTTGQTDEETVSIQVGLTAAETSQWYTAAQSMAEKADQESEGSIKLDIYPSGQLGSQTDLFDQMIAGSSVIGVGTPAYFADMGIADMSILAGPYIAADWDEMEKLTSSDWFTGLEKQLEEKGIKILNFNIQCGKRHTLATKEMHTPEDFKGRKIRVPNATTYIKIYEALGAAPVPMNLGEVYTSLSQGVIEGEDNNITTMNSEKHYEVAKYLVLDGHILDLQCLCTSTAYFNSLSENQQKALIASADTFAEVFNENTAKEEQSLIDGMAAQGVTVIDDCDPAAFAEATESFYTDPAISAQWSEGLYDTVKGILGR